jgi:hypothetical protein
LRRGQVRGHARRFIGHINIMSSEDDIKARLKEIEEDLSALRHDLQPPTDDPKDFGDAGADLEQREGLLGQIETLESERDRLSAQLGQT